jgi:hypothetical protein
MTWKMFAEDTYNWIVGPTYTLGEKEFRVVYNDFQQLGLLKYCKKSYNKKQGQMSIKTPWDSVLEVVSAEKQDSLLGEGLSHAIMSEAARHSHNTWEQYIEPALSDLLGTCDFPTTPKGYNWYHGLWEVGANKVHPDYISWQFPSWTNPIRYPGGLENPEIQRIKQRVSETYFQQEYAASFTTYTGAIYEEWDQEVHVQPCIYNPALANYLAFDYGFTNPFVCLDIQVSPDDTVYVWREYYERFKPTYEHGQALASRENPSDYRVDAMWGDPRGADEAATLALLLGIVGSFDVSWKLSVEQIKRMLKARPPQIYVDPSCVNFIREMSQLHAKPIATNAKQDLNEQAGDGNIQHKVNDHSPDAFRYFIGPHFVAGANATMEDYYGNEYNGSESQMVYDSLMGTHTEVKLDEELSLNRGF